MAYQPYYPGGWQPGPSGNTPLTADALNHMETQYDAVMAETTTPGGTEPNRILVGDDKGWAGGAHPWAIVPGDTVLISLPNQVSTPQGSGVVKTVRAPFIARFRVKGEYRSTTGGSPWVRVRVGGADGTVVAESRGTTSTQWQAFSVDMSSSAYAWQEISIDFTATGGTGLHGALRNVTFCGTYEPADFEAIDF